MMDSWVCVYGAIWELLLLALRVNQILQIILLTGNRVIILGENCKSDEVLGHSYFLKAVFFTSSLVIQFLYSSVVICLFF